jgi:hypothetical protein
MRATKAIWISATAFAAIAFAPQMASAERVCHSVCDYGVCRERCVERPSASVEIRTEGRRHHEYREYREERRPGVEFRAPGVGVEFGR